MVTFLDLLNAENIIHLHCSDILVQCDFRGVVFHHTRKILNYARLHENDAITFFFHQKEECNWYFDNYKNK